MTRDVISLTIPDLSQFTKALRADLLSRDAIPSHASLLSAISKAAGYDNHQHLKASKPQTSDPQLTKALRAFDPPGIMVHWPKQTTTQGLCLFAFWVQFPANLNLSEKEINAVLKAGHGFGDHPLLRRSLIDHKLLTRTLDGKIYRRLKPPARSSPRSANAALLPLKGRRAFFQKGRNPFHKVVGHATFALQFCLQGQLLVERMVK